MPDLAALMLKRSVVSLAQRQLPLLGVPPHPPGRREHARDGQRPGAVRAVPRARSRGRPPRRAHPEGAHRRPAHLGRTPRRVADGTPRRARSGSAAITSRAPCARSPSTPPSPPRARSCSTSWPTSAPRPAFADHYLKDYRLARANPRGKGAAARFLLDAPIFSERGELAIVEADRPRRIVEEARVGRRGRSRAVAVYDFTPEAGGSTRIELSTYSEPATMIDSVKQARSHRWMRRQTKKSLERLRACSRSLPARRARRTPRSAGTSSSSRPASAATPSAPAPVIDCPPPCPPPWSRSSRSPARWPPWPSSGPAAATRTSRGSRRPRPRASP